MRPTETIVWAGGEHEFRLAIGELRAIEQKCNAGISVILLRLLGQKWAVDDVLVPIRLGLIGGGMDPKDAAQVLDKASDTESLFALSVLSADVMRRFVMFDDDGDQPGEADAGPETTTETRSPTEKPDGQTSSEPEQSQG